MDSTWAKGLTIDDLGGAEENSEMNLLFPSDSLSKFVPAEGLSKFFSPIFFLNPPPPISLMVVP